GGAVSPCQKRTRRENGAIIGKNQELAPGDNPINPGSLKTYGFKSGVLRNLAAIQPGDGMEFGPRHLDFHPTQPRVYVSIESQNKLYVYKREPGTGLSREPLFVKETLSDAQSPFRQGAGTIHVH